MTDEDPPPRAWWCISERALLELLERAAAGEPPSLLVAEAYANADVETNP